MGRLLLLEELLPAVVDVEVPASGGSGVILDPSGIAATCRHIVGSTTKAKVCLRDGSHVPARPVLSLRGSDLTFLLLPPHPRSGATRASDTESTYLALPLATEREIVLGAEVYAIGSPAGLSQTVSRGIVSRIDCRTPGHTLIQTDASMSPGSSGGPLITRSGHLAGICAGGYTAIPGINFAIALRPLQAVISGLRSKLASLADPTYCPTCGHLGGTPRGFCGACGTAKGLVGALEIPCACCCARNPWSRSYCSRCGAELEADDSA